MIQNRGPFSWCLALMAVSVITLVGVGAFRHSLWRRNYSSVVADIVEHDRVNGGHDFDFVIVNRSPSAVIVSVTPNYFSGDIVLISKAGSVSILQTREYYQIVRTGPPGTSEIRLGPGESYSWSVDLQNLIMPDGEVFDFEKDDDFRILSIPKVAWYSSDGVPKKALPCEWTRADQQ